MSTPNLAKKLAAAAVAISHIPKSGYNEAQRYNFVTDADVLDTVRKQLSAQNVATTVGINNVDHLPFTTPKGTAQLLTTVSGDLTFLDADSGEIISVPFFGTGADGGDKGYYKAVTGGVKYALLKCLLVPTGDDPERDGAEQPSGNAAKSPVAPSARSAPSSVKEGLTEPQRKKLMATLEGQGIKETEAKRFVIKDLTGKHSTKQMTVDDLDTILKAAEAGFDDEFKVRALAAAS